MKKLNLDRIRNVYRVTMVCLLLFCLLLSTGCTPIQNKNAATTSSTEAETTSGDMESLTDYYIVTSIDTQKQTIRLQKAMEEDIHTLTYSGGTDIRDEYLQVISISQIQPGEVVHAVYNRFDKEITKLTLASDIWEYTDISSFSFDEAEYAMTIGGTLYQYNKNLKIFSNGEEITVEDLTQSDTLTVWGSGKEIFSISVTQGHGYVKLENEDYFVGGWIDIGNKVIQVITEDMILVVPEGTYEMTVANKGNAGTKTITIERDKELTVDLGEIEKEVVKSGTVTFSITPAEAVLTIDGEKTDYTKAITLEYGTYYLSLSAEGYTTETKWLVLKSASAKISIDLVEESTDDSSTDSSTADTSSTTGTTTGSTTGTTTGTTSTGTTSSGTTSSGTTNSGTSTSSSTADSTDSDSTSSSTTDTDASDTTEVVSSVYKVYITTPEDAEVYFDGVYKGIAPVAFDRTSGTHTITLRKTGYVNKSYTVTIANDEEDAEFAFSELTKTSE